MPDIAVWLIQGTMIGFVAHAVVTWAERKAAQKRRKYMVAGAYIPGPISIHFFNSFDIDASCNTFGADVNVKMWG